MNFFGFCVTTIWSFSSTFRVFVYSQLISNWPSVYPTCTSPFTTLGREKIADRVPLDPSEYLTLAIRCLSDGCGEGGGAGVIGYVLGALEGFDAFAETAEEVVAGLTACIGSSNWNEAADDRLEAELERLSLREALWWGTGNDLGRDMFCE